MEKVKEYLADYCKVCIGVDSPPKGLDHNTEFKEFVQSSDVGCLLMGYDEKTNSLSIEHDGAFDFWLLLTKTEGSLSSGDVVDMLDIIISSSINDVKELLTTHLSSVMDVNECTPESIENKILDAIKTDLFTNLDYLREIKNGNMSTVSTFEDEVVIQKSLRDIDQNKDADRFVSTLSRISTYTDPSKEHTSSQVDNSIREVVGCFRDLLTPKSSHLQPYSKQRAEKLVKVYADKLYKEAHKENSQIDLFDYENCNLRLKLSMWKDILKKYETECQELALSTGINVEATFTGHYQDYIKKLHSANYLRGIYDELIRYCKYFNVAECDQKLQMFNDKRKQEKYSAKQEREYFFKEFTSYLMKIVEYVDSQIVANFEKNPKENLVEIKKWNNIINYRKNTPEVKKIKDTLASKFSFVLDIVNSAYLKTSKSMDDGMVFIMKWRDAYQEYQNLKSLTVSVIDGLSDNELNTLAEYQDKYESLMKKFCSKLEEDTERMKREDKKTYEQTVSQRLDLNFEEQVYVFISPSSKSDKFSELIIRMKQYKLDNYHTPKFKSEVEEYILMKEASINMKQTLQNFLFHVEKVDDGLMDIVKSDKIVGKLISMLKSKQDGEYLCFSNLSEAESFVQEVF